MALELGQGILETATPRALRTLPHPSSPAYAPGLCSAVQCPGVHGPVPLAVPRPEELRDRKKAIPRSEEVARSRGPRGQPGRVTIVDVALTHHRPGVRQLLHKGAVERARAVPTARGALLAEVVVLALDDLAGRPTAVDAAARSQDLSHLADAEPVPGGIA